MKFLASRKLRIFLICWIVFTIHFATNVVREHYPAFSLLEDGDLELDEYIGFHSDIFWHEKSVTGPNGEEERVQHAYVGNQITGSLPALLPLFVFSPVLDRLEEHSLARLAERPEPRAADFASEYPNRVRFMRLVREQGLDLRFGAATAVTSAFCMAPLCALLVIMIYGFLLGRGIDRNRATGLAFLFAFATPIFYRAAHLNHNVFLTVTVFLTWLLTASDEDDAELPPWRLLGGGFMAGLGVALDYAGVIPLLCFYACWGVRRWRAVGFARAFGSSLYYVLGSIPPVAFLCWTQKIMYGAWFQPGQAHMPPVNYSDQGWHGMTLPDPRIIIDSLVSWDYGLFAFAPLLLIGLVPWLIYRRESRLLRPANAWSIEIFALLFLLFQASNQYSRMQFNTGVRYLLPLVPLVFILVAEHLRRLPLLAVWLLGLCCGLHVWVLSMVRFTTHGDLQAVPECWRRFLHEGLQLPWLNTLRQSMPDAGHFIHWRAWPFLILALAGLKCFFIWRAGAAHEAPEAERGDPPPRPAPVEVVSEPEA